jgi:hypothetical protein
MKFLKTYKINNKKAKDLSVTYRADGQIIMNSTVSLALPIGKGDPEFSPGTANNQRPDDPYNNSGLLRYNTSLRALEVLQEGEWFVLKTKTPDAVKQQKFLPRPTPTSGVAVDPSGIYVDGTQIYFGPLVGQNPKAPVVGATNILVFVENVPQMAGDNYSVVESGTFTAPSGLATIYPTGSYLKFESPPPMGKTIYVLHGFD